MDETRTISQKWLINELVLPFSALERRAGFQSNSINLSRRFDENFERDFSHKSNTFSYDENVIFFKTK